MVASKLHVEDFPGIIKSLTGVVFLGTPHKGSKWQSPAAIIATAASALGLGEQSKLLNAVQQDSEMLQDLVQDFTRTVNRTSVSILCFFEQLKSDITKLIKGRNSFFPSYKVTSGPVHTTSPPLISFRTTSSTKTPVALTVFLALV